ncbi:MAG: response regulator [Kofleriaceae bacterium]
MQSVLLVDDDERLVSSVARALRVFLPGRTIHVVHSGFEAASVLQTRAWEAVVTDFSMSDGDGDYVLALAAQLHPNAIRILVTARDEMPKNVDAHHRFTKPYNVGEIATLIERWPTDRRTIR